MFKEGTPLQKAGVITMSLALVIAAAVVSLTLRSERGWQRRLR